MTDAHLGLVGFTRMKLKFGLYGSHEDISDFAKRLGVERFKENALEGVAQPGVFKNLMDRLKQRKEQAQVQPPHPVPVQKRKRGMEM